MNLAIWHSGAMSSQVGHNGTFTELVESSPTVEILATFEKWSMVRYWPVEVSPEPFIVKTKNLKAKP